jgi:hypothetical protein
MPRISDLWRARIHLFGLGLVAIVPAMLQRTLFQAHIYDIRWAGGLHPSDLLELRMVGGLAIYVPFIIVAALIISWFRPAMIHRLLTFCVTIFILFLLIFLFQAVFVIVLNVPPPHT